MFKRNSILSILMFVFVAAAIILAVLGFGLFAIAAAIISLSFAVMSARDLM